MASSSKICRLSSKIHSLTQKLSKTNVHASSLPSPIKSSSPSSATTRINQSFRSVSLSKWVSFRKSAAIMMWIASDWMVKNRLPVELSSCLSMLPLHSAIASARLISSLSVESKSWALVPQGHSFSSLHIICLFWDGRMKRTCYIPRRFTLLCCFSVLIPRVVCHF